jgi:hypothetical protein
MIDATLENSPAVLFDAMVLPGGAEAVETLCLDGHVFEFVKDQYRHGKTILALGDSAKILDRVGIPKTLPSGAADPGLLIGRGGSGANARGFIAAIARHRHTERDREAATTKFAGDVRQLQQKIGSDQGGVRAFAAHIGRSTDEIRAGPPGAGTPCGSYVLGDSGAAGVPNLLYGAKRTAAWPRPAASTSIFPACPGSGWQGRPWQRVW